MATRMQQRRGTAAQWTTANTVLAAGEIGFEIDTNQFKIGDGVNVWPDLDYFGATDSVLADLIAGAPEALDTLGEIANALGNSPDFANTVLDHISYTSNVHGIANTLVLATQSDVQNAQTAAHSYTDSEITTHNDLTDNVHGIANTLVLATKDYVANAAGSGIDWNSENEQFDLDATIATQTYVSNAVSDHSALTENIHGIANTLVLATLTNVENARTNAISVSETAANTTVTNAISALTKSSVGLANVDNTSDADKPVSTATQTALDLKAPLASPTFTGTVSAVDLTLSGDLTVNGTTTNLNSTNLVIEDKNIVLGDAATPTDVTADGGGITLKGATDKTFNWVDATDSWTSSEHINLASGKDLKVNGTSVISTTAGGFIFTDGTQTKEGVPSRTPIVQKTDSYTLSSLTERDSLIEVLKATGTTITIPLNASVAFPVGTSIDILQTGAGQVTIAGTAGVTVNATPGLKLRTQWSSATLFKRAENTWVAFGDLTA